MFLTLVSTQCNFFCRGVSSIHASPSALQTQSRSRAQITELLTALSPSQAPKTRSQAKAEKFNDIQKHPAAPSLQDAPIYELSVTGMDEEQIWAQLELRAQNLADVLEYALEGTGVVPESDNESEGSSMKRRRTLLDLEEDEVDDMDMDMDGADFTQEESDDDDDDMESEGEDDDDDDDEEYDESESGGGGSEDEHEGLEQDYGEDVAELRDPSDGEGDVDLDVPSTKKRKGRGKAKGRGHPELDDGFFDLAAFNRETEEAEARASSRGKLGRGDGSDDEDEDVEDVDLFAPVDDAGDVDMGDEPGMSARVLNLTRN